MKPLPLESLQQLLRSHLSLIQMLQQLPSTICSLPSIICLLPTNCPLTICNGSGKPQSNKKMFHFKTLMNFKYSINHITRSHGIN
ncbi:uncharacterized protein ASCRUDRAFT_82968 [Ascoidea rubescens DSM 1968]|uniref:Uncharacterized protein n=1 Tax=Ascoidea rubescens DSM 1968 TaxID=1344418 RepID=A0A1D2V964_9ASCO|nr:hypothetical protein ASCRUDRAFT_82968 [Ascoidea rubescens DSM 1968]ODV58168.1 hypothetical protein ASCRUDRAFT_82968 [Ascoidea rubescens DSM 1968]